MPTTTHVKLGLLALLTLAAVVITALALGLRRRPADTYYTYFDESVQGLELGAQVKYLGVPIGSVSSIEIAPDHHYVQVALAIERARVRTFDLASIRKQLRAELVMIGITGLKIVDLEPAGPSARPAPELAFRPAEPYIPSEPSLLKNLQEGLELTGQRLQVLVEHTIAAIDKVELAIDDVRREGLPQRVAMIVESAGGATADLRSIVRRLDRTRTPEKLASAVGSLDRAAQQLTGILARVGGEDGLLASAHRATESVGELGTSTLESANELEPTLREIRDAARAVREFMDQLERQPDMLLKGRARTRR